MAGVGDWPDGGTGGTVGTQGAGLELAWSGTGPMPLRISSAPLDGPALGWGRNGHMQPLCPNPNQDWCRTELKGVCFSPFGTPQFAPVDLLLKGMQCLKCTLWVSETYHTTEVKTAQRGLRTG